MSAQSGIKPTQELKDRFAASGNVRALRVELGQETLECVDSIDIQGTWSQDFSRISSWFQPVKSCFLIYQLDGPNLPTSADEQPQAAAVRGHFLLGLYVPDNAPVRHKMLYASSRATLSKELGESKFIDYLYGSTPNDFTLEGYIFHRKSQTATAPLTARETELKNVKMSEGIDIVSTSTKRSLIAQVGGGGGMLQFPVSPDASNAIDAFVAGNSNLVVLSIDVKAEIVNLNLLDTLANLDQLVDHAYIKNGNGLKEPRYVLYKYDGSRIVFAMVVPETATIKERTLYSSTRGSIIGFIDAKLGEGNAITKKFELDHIKEFNMAQLKYEFGFAATGSTAADGTASSSTSVSANKFSKPSKPGRGAQRVTQQ